MLFLAVVKIGLCLNLVDLESLAESFPTVRAAESFLILNGWPWWQLGFISEAVLTFGFFFFADAALARYDSDHPWHENTVLKTTFAASLVRATVAVPLMAYLFGVAVQVAFPRLVRWMAWVP